MKISIIPTLGIAILAILAVFVWPTRYKYDHIKMGEPYEAPVRIDRFTGKTEILFPEGWRTAGRGNRAEGSEQELPAEELAKLAGQGQITPYGWVEIEVYNGSNWTLSEIVWGGVWRCPLPTRSVRRTSGLVLTA